MRGDRSYRCQRNVGDFVPKTSRERFALRATRAQVPTAFLFKLGELWARLELTCIGRLGVGWKWGLWPATRFTTLSTNLCCAVCPSSPRGRIRKGSAYTAPVVPGHYRLQTLTTGSSRTPSAAMGTSGRSWYYTATKRIHSRTFYAVKCNRYRTRRHHGGAGGRGRRHRTLRLYCGVPIGFRTYLLRMARACGFWDTAMTLYIRFTTRR